MTWYLVVQSTALNNIYKSDEYEWTIENHWLIITHKKKLLKYFIPREQIKLLIHGEEQTKAETNG